LINGHEGGLKLGGMTPMQKISLRFVVLGVLFYGLAAIEGMMMRVVEITPVPAIDDTHFFSIMTVHPMVGVFGSTYMIVFGAFLFLLPFFMKKPIFSLKLANASWLLIGGGTFIMWLAGFLFSYAPLYTLYWPLPADFAQFTVVGGLFYVVGVALIMVGTFLYSYNVFKTIMYTPEGWDKQPSMELFKAAIGFKAIGNFFKGKKTEHIGDLPVAAISRGTIDVGLNAVVITAAGVLLLIYMFGALFGVGLEKTWVDALLYKNIFWWGLDLIADGLVLIFVAGTWYILAMMITGKDLFMKQIARAALFVEMVVSWTVWSHHLMSDQGQSNVLSPVRRNGHGPRTRYARPRCLRHAGHPVQGPSAQDDERVAVPPGRTARFHAGSTRRYYPGRSRDEPGPAQYAVDRRVARSRRRPRRTDDDPLLGYLSIAAHPHQWRKTLQPETGNRAFLVAPGWRHRHGILHGHGRHRRHVEKVCLCRW
jgi:hypothetical protein